MEREPREHRAPAPVGEAERETAVEVLQRAAADGRLRLGDLSDRVGTALTAENADQLDAATAGIGTAPDVGTTRSVSSVVAILGDRRQVGRWRLPRALRAYGLLGDVHLDLRDVVVADDVVEIRAVTFFGNLCVDVPEGVEVELSGYDVLGDRELRLAPVPRRAQHPAHPHPGVRHFRGRGRPNAAAGGGATQLVGLVQRQPPAPTPPPRPPGLRPVIPSPANRRHARSCRT